MAGLRSSTIVAVDQREGAQRRNGLVEALKGELPTAQTPRVVGSPPVCLSVKPVGEPTSSR